MILILLLCWLLFKDLEQYTTDQTTLKNMVTLPGLDQEDMEKFGMFGLNTPSSIFGQYLTFRRDQILFTEFMEKEVGVFLNNKKKRMLLDSLETKYHIIKYF